jgi:hypothetical protein
MTQPEVPNFRHVHLFTVRDAIPTNLLQPNIEITYSYLYEVF